MKGHAMSLGVLTALLGISMSGGAVGEEPSLRNVPPVVVKTSPQAGAAGVPATVKEIRIQFSKPMMDKSWSVVKISDASFPGIAGKPRYLDDGTTFVLPVQLKSGQSYALWVNQENFQGFRDRDGRPAIPYLLVFEVD